jgi:hypothetical protein
MIMRIDWKSMVIGFLLGACLLLIAAQAQKANDPIGQYQINTGNSTWVINTNTGDTWQISGETTSGTTRYTWAYAGKPAGTTSGATSTY